MIDFASTTTPKRGRILRMRDLATRCDRNGKVLREGETGLGKTTIYRLIESGEFPRGVRIGRQAVGWHESDIERWKSERASTL